MKALRYILYGLLAAAVIGMLVFFYYRDGSLKTADLLRAGLILAGIALALLRPLRRQRVGSKKSVYQKAYSAFIGDAFSDDKKLEKKFYNAIEDYNRNRPAAAIDKLTALRQECQRTQELYAVTVFTALCQDDMGDYHNAIKSYDAALKIRPTATIYSNMGLCCQRLGQFADACDAYEKSIALDSKNAVVYNNISSLYFKEGEYEAALHYAQLALERNAAMTQALSTAAVCCALLDDEENYQRYYRQAVSNGYNGQKIKNAVAALSDE